MRSAVSIALRRFTVAVGLCFAVLAAGAARGEGPVVEWGAQATPPPSVDGREGTASAIAAGSFHSCAIQAGSDAADSGAVVCWGDNSSGQATPPPSVDGSSAGTASAIAAGGRHSCAIEAGSGAVVCWGDSSYGQARPPRSVNGRVRPGSLQVPGRASAIAAGGNHGCAIQADTGAVVCWGYNYSGQATPPPSVDGTNGTASAIAAGSDHSCAIQADTGAVVCWGFGQAAPPWLDGTAAKASAIAAGGGHSCAIVAGIVAGSGPVFCWGSNYSGQATPPVSVVYTDTATAIAAGHDHSCAIQADSGAVVCWGYNSSGQATPPPSVNGTAGTATAIAAGFGYTLTIGTPECLDGVDSLDGDGLVDYPDDPGCDSPTDPLETSPALVCDDGLDNDGDFLADVADPGCDSPTDPSERSPSLVCDDGLDNDGDGLVDYPSDPNCRTSDSEIGACQDGIDGDGDGLTDFPADPGCDSGSDDSERGVACDDGVDNDGDGSTDYPADPDCSALDDVLEDSDADSDEIVDLLDNCIATTNRSQLDANQDGYGDACDADYDGDGVVGASDLARLEGAFGATLGSENYDPALDADGDGVTGEPEVLLLQTSYGKPPGPSALSCAGTVPCPDYYSGEIGGCGLGVELTLVLPPLMWLYRRRRA